MRRFFRARATDDLNIATLAMRLTAIIVVLHPVPAWYLRAPLYSLGILVLVFPKLLRTPLIWAGIALFLGAWVVRYWPSADNHLYLFTYWTLAIALALCSTRTDWALAVSARWLIVAVFFWATLWKAVLSPDYMDGRFYRVRLLTDARFSQVVQFVGGMSAEEIEASRLYLQPPPQGIPKNVSPRLVETRSFVRFAMFLTWATVLLEAAVGLVFLLPWGRWTSMIRHGLLLTFCATAYAIAPVVGFGSLLLAMGVAQVPENRSKLRFAYVGVFLLVRLYAEVPWTRFLLAIGARATS